MWKWILIVLGVLAGLIGLTALLGTFVEPHHEATVSARFAAPPEEVFALITDRDRFTAWREDLESLEPRPDVDGKPSWVEHSSFGDLHVRLDALEPPRLYKVSVLHDPDVPYTGSWTYEIEPDGTGSRVTITEEGEIHSAIFRALARFVFGYHQTMTEVLRALGRHLGEAVTPEDVR